MVNHYLCTMDFFVHNLSNGIRCVLQRTKAPVVWCALTVDAGSRDETPKEHGMAHFTEHMLFKGTARRRAHHINSRLEKLGGELNAYTTKEETAVYATVLRGDFAAAADLIADVVFNSTFPEAEIAKEREVVADEIDSYRDSPSDSIYDEFEDLLFAGSPLGHNILGTRKEVARIGARGLRGFVERTYNTDRMVFSAVGNITERAFVATVERFFGGVAANPRAFGRVEPAAAAHFDTTSARRTHQSHCVMGARAYSAADPRRTALALLVNIIGGPAANSRLNEILREKNGLTYTAEAAYTPFSDLGMATIYFGTEREKVARCRELIDGVLHNLRSRALTTRELAAAKKQFTGQFAIAQQSHEGMMLAAGKSILLYGEVDPPAEVYKKIAVVTATALLEAANDVFSNVSALTYG
jgi:predicted Zn-dependent peptidase